MTMTISSPYKSMDGQYLERGDIAYQIRHDGPIEMQLVPVKVIELLDSFKRTILIVKKEREQIIEQIVVSNEVCVDPLRLLQETIDLSENFIDDIIPRRIMFLSLLKEKIAIEGNPEFTDTGLFIDDLEI